MRLQVEVFDQATSAPVGLLEQRTSGDIVTRYCDLGSWMFKVPVAAQQPDVLAVLDAYRAAIRVTDLDQPSSAPVMAGPQTQPQRTWGVSDPFGGSLTVSGVSWESVLDRRITYADPSQPWAGQSATGLNVRPTSGTTAAEMLLRGFVNDNAGPAALPVRRWPGFTLETAPPTPRGAALRISSAKENLLELCQRIALLGGLGFWVEFTAAGALIFHVTQPVTRSDVLLSVDAGTVLDGSVSASAPTVTRALVAGQAAFVERASTTAETEWVARIERLVDQSSTANATELQQAGDQALAEGAARAKLTVTVQDTDQVRYGRDYQLGDVVPYEQLILSGPPVVDQAVVREVRFTETTGDVTRVRATLGDPDASETPEQYRRLTRLERAARRLFRRT